MATKTMPADQEFERAVVKSVRKVDGGYVVLREDGWSLWVVDAGIEPEPGDVMRCYGRGLGFTVRGIAFEGKGVVRYETAQEERQRFAREQEERKARQRAEFKAKKADHDLRIRELPLPFRLRIEGFQKARPDWRWEYEGYELFVCEEAVKIAHHFEGDNAIWRLNEWAALPYEEQQKALPMSDDHSGNTFGAAVALARTFLLDNHNAVTKMHGALCPLVGCEEYGCPPARRAHLRRTTDD